LRTVQDSWDGLMSHWDVSHVTTFGACTTQGTHLPQKWARMMSESRIVGDGLTCLTFGACTIQGTHYTKRWARIVETVRIVGDGLTCLIQCMYLQGTHLHQGGPG
jgi:hypothetical protein